MRNKRFCVFVILSAVFVGTAYGQQKGQWILGTTGLNAGIQPGPGFSYDNQGTVYWADRLKGSNGNAIPIDDSFDLRLDQNMFVYTSKYKLLGATYGAMFDLVIANGALTSSRP